MQARPVENAARLPLCMADPPSTRTCNCHTATPPLTGHYGPDPWPVKRNAARRALLFAASGCSPEVFGVALRKGEGRAPRAKTRHARRER